MSIYTVLAILLPLFLAAIIIFARFRYALPLVTLSLVLLTGTIYSVLYSPWYLYSYWALAAIVVAALVALVVGILKLRSTAWGYPGSIRSIAVLIFVGLFVFMAIRIPERIALMQPPKDSIELAFPLKDGIFAVRRQSQHPSKSTTYAVDIVQLGASGRVSSELLGDDHEDDIMFDAPVYAPCSGQILWSRNDMIDKLGRNPVTPAGNGVIMSCKGVQVYLTHLKKGSVLAEVGDEVREGEMIGRVGASGNTSITHLHIHAERGEFLGEVGGFDVNEPVGILFENQGYPWQHKLFLN